MENDQPHFSWVPYLVTSSALGLAGGVGIFFALGEDPALPLSERLLVAVAVFVFGGLFYGGFFYFPILWIRKAISSFTKKTAKAEELSATAGQLQERLEQDFFTTLVRINFKFLDAYYLQTQLQADKSFLLTAGAAIVSLVVIVAGIVMLFFDKLNPATVTVATGTLGEVMAGIFFYLYNRTISSMGDYHKKLVLTQNVGIALKIAETLPEPERVKAQEKLIENLVQDINAHLSGSLKKEA